MTVRPEDLARTMRRRARDELAVEATEDLTPERRRTAARIARLRAELTADRAALARRREDAEAALRSWDGRDPSREKVGFSALSLHAWYTGLEAALERIARELDTEVPRGARWHQELLTQASAELPGIRPAVLPDDLLSELIGLLAFRRFVRHAYAVDLDAARVGEELERLHRIGQRVEEALEAFDRFLGAAIAAD